MSPNSLSDLQLFVEKVDWLLKSTFYSEVMKDFTGVLFEFSADSGTDDVLIGPEGESVDSALLTLRMFMQDNDRISIRNISKIFDSEPELANHRDDFETTRTHINSTLDESAGVDFFGKVYSLRETLELYLYGSRGHTKRAQEQELKEILTAPSFIANMFLNNVNRAIALFIGNLGSMSTTIKRAL